MKIYRRPIDEQQQQWMFAPIRSKTDALKLLVRTLKIFLAPTGVPKGQVTGEASIAVSKMSRIFYSSNDKIFSISLPFQVSESERGLAFKCASHPSVDNRATSELLSLLDDELLCGTDVIAFADVVQTACDIDTDIWGLFRYLLFLEEGYVRYDYDRSNANGDLHPLHHLDVFYSQGTTFKAGLDSRIQADELSDILDITTVCRYLRG